MEQDTLKWFKSSASGAAGCVEAAKTPGGGMAIRDTKDRARPPHVFTREEWNAFLRGVRAGESGL